MIVDFALEEIIFVWVFVVAFFWIPNEDSQYW